MPLLPGSLATVFATVTYFILVFPCIAGGAYIIATTSVSQFMAALERLGAPRSFSITLAVTLRFLPALRQDFRHIRDAMALRQIHGRIPLSAWRRARVRNAAEELEPLDFCFAAKDLGVLRQRLPANAREKIVAAKERAAGNQPGNRLRTVRIG